MKKQVAAALTDALLSQPPRLAPLVACCADVLGSRPAWLRLLVRELLKSYGERWDQRSRAGILEAILASPLFGHAWIGGGHLRVRQYVLAPPRMAPGPDSFEACRPDLPTQADLARWLDLEPQVLEGIVRSLQYRDAAAPEALQHYRYRWLAKRSGGFRLLEAPKPRLCAVQRKILTGLLEYLPPHEAAHGFRRARSCRTHAAQHVGQAVVVRLDLQDFFLNVGAGRVRALFRSLGYPDGVAHWLTVLCIHRAPKAVAEAFEPPGHAPELRAVQWRAVRRLRSPHLPQGAPTSPALANLCAFALDVRLQAAADACGANYSRYADDLTFSGDRAFQRAVERFIPLAGAIAADEGFAVNFRKTRVMAQSTRQHVTGVVVNEGVNVDRRYYDRIKATLHNCRRFGAASQTDLPLPEFRLKLAGHVSHIGACNPERGRRLKAMLAEIVWDA